ncbi:MAG: FeoA family protein, partial [Solirubrobacteraceae bacterium]
AEVLRYLSETARIGPGTEFVLDEKQPFGGAVLLCVGQQRVVLARALAARVRVRPTESVQDRGVDRG